MTKEVRPVEQLVKGLLDQALGAGVHAGGGFVQNQDARVCQGGACDGEQLPLSLREAGAAFAQDGLIFFGQAFDEGVRVGQSGGGYHFFIGGIRSAKADVLHDGVC